MNSTNHPPATLTDAYQLIHTRLNGETARLQWHELLPHFASGAMVTVDASLDLIDVAVRISLDDTAAVSAWMGDGLVSKVSDALAAAWTETDPLLWSVIVKPWILVQPATQG
ncbi:DUF2288 domain-containing protein [Actimicrobium sp. CCC2.4]|jgi:hypothetical protein|uniref:DUF2288 domain-containing protein n=1 Tax=Actimicrobium sp. CCC2.4 TaxID=3048606 RepID=UPI002AC95FA8|nr:DUF2288 domain-containing protein [Actimicrobium sp. CCC2.4]MEB0136075.1 DUF2288 domain-containing protein [Actimicrobium sp. CCC2.4]WPX32167.1 DUF2288 domain-containing protein [Actimicrobium sp. CCC2.4]